MARVLGLGHIGLYVRDLDRMAGFYRDFMGMRVTKQNPGRIVFLSADPEACDHEIALIQGRTEQDDPHLIDQISLRVETLDDLRDFHRRVQAEGLRLDRVVNHGSALGCYFFDPEGNRTEVFWVTGRPVWVPTSEPVDLSQPDEVILAHVDQIFERERDVPMGAVREPVRA
jgi:catechol-2,3-dioxygenase